MKNRYNITALVLISVCALFPCHVLALDEKAGEGGLAAQYEKIQMNLSQSLQELSEIQKEIAAEKLPLAKQIGRREEALSEARAKYERLSSRLDSGTLDLNNLRTQIEGIGQQKTYISSLLGEYIRSLETQLHISEVQIYEDQIGVAKLALSNEALDSGEVFKKQLAIVEASIARLEKLNGGVKFKGQAVGAGGAIEDGEFILIGPTAFFSAANGTTAGYVVEMIGSTKPNVISFGKGDANADFLQMTRNAVNTGKGQVPIDPTLGNAQKIAETQDTLWEHVQKGGIVMIPILALATLALIIALGKWFELSRVKMPSEKSLSDLLNDIRDRAFKQAKLKARSLTGPAGEMLQIALDHIHHDHIHHSKELVEEVMYEKILETRTRLNKALPFIAVCASSAPLLGLLGTVTGIINTFKLISAFGSGDAKTLSGGISEALVTTEFGLIVAIPSLLLHAFLNRKAKSHIDSMERIAVGVLNRINQSEMRENDPPGRETSNSPIENEHKKEVFLG